MAGASVVATGRWNGGNLRRGAEQDLNYLQRQANGFSKSVIGSFTGIGASLGAIFAAGAIVDFFKESAQAAMEDEKSMVALSKAMDNVGLAAQNAKAEGLIESMMLQTGIADDRLRPAYQKLVTVTKDVTEAQGLLQTALDLSAAGYGELEATSKALSAAANGNFTALQRLKVPIDQNALAAKDFDAAVASLNRTVGGQAAAAAQTYAGQMDRITVAVGEAQEAIGYSLLNALDRMTGKMGGTGGVQDVIVKSGEAIAEFVDGVALTGDQVGRLVLQMARLTTFGLVPAERQFSTLDATIGILKGQLALLVGPLVTLMMYLEELGIINSDTGDETRKMTSATVASAVAAGKAQGRIGDLADETENAGDKAWYATQSYLAFYESLVKGQQAARDFANTSNTVSSGIREGVELGGSPLWEQLRARYGEVEKAARSAGSGTKELSKAQEEAKQSSQELQQNVESLATSLQGLVDEVSPPIATAANATFDAISKQVEKFKSTLAEAKSYAQGIVDGFMGQLDIGKALEDAKATGTTLVEAFVKQGDKVIEFGRKMNALLRQGLSKAAFDDIMKLGYERGTEVADALAQGNVAGNIANINTVYSSVKTMAEEIADAAASAFYKAGLDMMLNMIRALIEGLGINGKQRKRLLALMDDLAGAMSRTVTLTVRTVVEGSGVPSAISAGGVSIPTTGMSSPEVSDLIDGILNSGGTPIPIFADGGVVTSPTLGLFGEAGPEAVIPLDRMAGGGSTYNITVQAGVGDPRAIGKSVVEAITLFERSSGPVFARA